MDFRFGQVCVLVSGATGQKTSSGRQLGLGDFFPSLSTSVVQPSKPNLRVVQVTEADEARAGWERWAQMCRQVSKQEAG